jgi:hypothetical protein
VNYLRHAAEAGALLRRLKAGLTAASSGRQVKKELAAEGLSGRQITKLRKTTAREARQHTARAVPQHIPGPVMETSHHA